MSTLNNIIQKIAKIIFRAFYFIAATAFAFLLSILLYNVLSRNLFGGAISWIEELSSFIFTWMMFLGISIGVYYKKHLGVDFLIEKYPEKLQKKIKFFSSLLSLVTFLILAVYGSIYSFNTMRMFSPILKIPYGLIYLCVPICGLLSAFYCIAGILDQLYGIEKEG